MDPVRLDHEAEMLEALPPTLDKPTWRALVTSAAGQFQAIEDAAIAIIVQRSLANAVGAQLDQLGKRVRQPREGRGDADYKRVIGAKVAVNTSQGMREDLILVARLALLDPTVRVALQATTDPAAVAVMTLEGLVSHAASTDVVTFAQRAAQAGVRVIVESWSAPVAEMFRLDDDTPGAGFATPPALDISPPLTTFDDVICVDPDYARDNANDVFTLAFVADPAAPATGELDDTGYPDLVFRFLSGVTTIGDCEARIAESHYLFVARAAASPADTMNDSDDEFPAQPLVGSPGGVFATAQDGRETYPPPPMV